MSIKTLNNSLVNWQQFQAHIKDRTKHAVGDTFPTGVQGDVIYHNGTSWVILNASTDGYFLKTQGAGANPIWAEVFGGTCNLRFVDDYNILAGTNAGRLMDGLSGTNAYDNLILGHGGGYTLANSWDTGENIILGNNALHMAPEAIYSVIAGFSAGYNIINSDSSIIIGHEACKGITSAKGPLYSVFIGYQSGYGIQNVDGGDTADGIVSIGAFSGSNVHDIWFGGVYIGYNAGLENTIGDKCVFIGPYAGQENTTGTDNTYIGYNVGTSAGGTGHDNTIVGSATIGPTTGYHNAWFGSQMANSITTGYENSLFGFGSAAHLLTSSYGNLCLGSYSGPSTPAIYNNMMWIDNHASDTPLIGADFSAHVVTITGDLTVTGAVIGGTGAGNHAGLSNLAYASAGHTGFEPTITALEVTRGGTALATVALGSVLVAQSLNTLSALTSTSGTKVLTNTDGVLSWEVSAGGGFDPTAVESITWGGGAGATIVHTFNVAGTDTSMTYGNGIITASCPLNATTGFQIGGAAATGTILRGNGTNFVATTATYPATTTAYKLLVSTATSVIGELDVGTTGKLLMGATGAVPVWTTPTYPNTATAGKILVGDGTNIVLSTPLYPNASATAGKVIRSDGTDYAASTATFADTYAVSTILYASSANVVSGLATGNSGVLVTSAGGVPSIASTIAISNIPAMTSAEFATKISDETGTDKVVFNTSPTFVTQIAAPKVIATSAAGLSLFEDGGSGIFIKDGGNVEFGGVTAFYPLTVNGVISGGLSPNRDASLILPGIIPFLSLNQQTCQPGIILNVASANWYESSVLLPARSRGTLASPTPVAKDDRLFLFAAIGHGNTGWETNATGLFVYVDAAPIAASNHVPTRLVFTGVSTAGVALDWITCNANGAVTVNGVINGSAAANGDLTLEGTSSGTKTTSYVNLQTTGGYVGIGTTAPARLLDLSGNINGIASIGLLNANAGASAQSEFRIGSNLASNTNYLALFYDNTSNTAYSVACSNVVGGFIFQTNANAPVKFTTNQVSAPKTSIILGTGQLGSNTITPSAQIAINGGVHVGGDSDPGDNNLLVDGNTTLGLANTNTITFTGRAIFRTAASDPKHATPGSRPAGSVAEIVYYSGKMYFCTNAATPTWELITSA